MTAEENRQRYLDAMRTVRSGVAFMETHDLEETSPRYIRVGVHSAMVDCAAIAALLIDKGVITTEEYYAELAHQAEEKAESYRQAASQAVGKEVTLR